MGAGQRLARVQGLAPAAHVAAGDVSARNSPFWFWCRSGMDWTRTVSNGSHKVARDFDTMRLGLRAPLLFDAGVLPKLGAENGKAVF